MLKPRNIVFLAIAYCLVPMAFANAQTIDPVRVVISPETPGPNETVRLEAQGVGTFIGESNVTWRLNGEVALSGVGERVFTFTTGALGSRSTVSVSINSAVHGVITREFTFIPSTVSLVWEADTYTPPFFRGKALYSAGSPLKVVAYPTIIVNGSQAAISGLSFQWSRNGESVAAASGLGRNMFSFVGDQLQTEERVSVDIYVGNARIARGGIIIPVSEPLVLLYNRDPLRGVVYDQAFPQAISLAGREISVQAEPYYFSNASRRSSQLSYTWTLNGAETTGPDAAGGLLTLRQEGSGGGEATLGIAVQSENVDELLQRAEALVRIVFGSGQTTAATDPFASGLSAAVAAFNRLAQAPAQSVQYTPLEPLAPDLQGQQPITDLFQKYLVRAFNLLIVAGAMFAVLMLTIGGITYMVSEVPGVKLDALDRAKAALFGLLLIAAAFLILRTINPELLNLNLFIQGTQTTGAYVPPAQNPSTQGTPPSVTDLDRIRTVLGSSNLTPAGPGILSFPPGTTPERAQVEQFKNDCSGRGDYQIHRRPEGLFLVCAGR